MVTLKGRTDVAHIPYQPFWMLIVRGFQLVLAIVILGLSAYSGGGYLFVCLPTFWLWLRILTDVFASMLDMGLVSSLLCGLCSSSAM